MITMTIAHKKSDSDVVQTIMEHSYATAKIAEQFSVEPLKQINYCMGLLHDIGKFQRSFQDRITGVKNIKVEHSICGAIEAGKLFGNNAAVLMMQYCIAGHHSGIPDGGVQSDTHNESSLYGRLKRESLSEDYSEYKTEITIKQPDISGLAYFMQKCPQCRTDRECFIETFAFITRYCFSCLTDADSLDTAYFCNGRKHIELTSDFYDCLRKLNEKLSSFKAETELQKTRSVLQQQVYDKVSTDSEIYLMNMPTSSGKTLCSMKFALERAVKTGKKRIIYVIPYNSIIDQTVDEFEKTFGESAQILRHQSSFSIDDTDKDEDYRQLLKNVTENWNAQIIVTTSVQFFESVYANKRNKLRKLHNMADSMIIFDEAHLMPVEYIKPCLRAVSYITRLLNSEAVFLTATMPDFNDLIKKYALNDSSITDLITDRSLFGNFKKGQFINIGKISEEGLLSQASSQPSSLIVVNKRRTAAKLYEMLPESKCKKFHLSTYMTAYDRKRVIDSIKKELAQLYKDYPALDNVPEDRHIVVISTSLIEAGIDLDFSTVYRELSGLDSILQAGGRCNREGKRQNGIISIFRFDSLQEGIKENITRSLTESYTDISSPECIEEYYRRIYDLNDEMIKEQTIAKNVSRINSIPFAEYAGKFRLIDDSNVSVAVECNDESKALIAHLRACGFTDYRTLRKYCFTIYKYELKKLTEQGAVKEYGGIWCLENKDYYDPETGISFEARDYYL